MSGEDGDGSGDAFGDIVFNGGVRHDPHLLAVVAGTFRDALMAATTDRAQVAGQATIWAGRALDLLRIAGYEIVPGGERRTWYSFATPNAEPGTWWQTDDPALMRKMLAGGVHAGWRPAWRICAVGPWVIGTPPDIAPRPKAGPRHA